MKSVLVIGGNGFIGRNVVRHLLQCGYQVFSLDRHHSLVPEKNLSLVQGDLNFADLVDLLDKVDSAVYLASSSLPADSTKNPIADIEDNLFSLIRFLMLLEGRVGFKFVYASSGGTVYGPSNEDRLTEQSPTDPICAYGISKLAAEKYIAMLSQRMGFHSTVLRLSNPYGPGQNPHKPQGAVGVFLYRVLNNLPIEIWGDGSVVRDYIWIGDVNRAFEKALNYHGPVKLFNIGSGLAVSLNQLIHEIEQASNTKASVKYGDSRKVDVPKNVLDVSLAETCLGWKPQTSLNSGLERYKAYFDAT